MTETDIGTELLDSAKQVKVDSCGCSVVSEIIDAPAKFECPLSGTLSMKIFHETLENLIVLDKRHLISKDVQYYYCSEPDCPVVYFSNGETPVFEKSDLTVKVFSKDIQENVHVCYCFDWTRKRITDQIGTTGSSTAFIEITEELRAGNCECEIQNPKGACCLGDIQNFMKENM
ncbi:MAG: (2Fe-2S)-binding protein [Candidatus Marinimicrobia bacterium]|nr:(2Fe-2S)-binding protein [Candidatus Neomarinimicrobiota bacterium]